MGELDPYTGRWSDVEVGHLLRRTTFVTSQSVAKTLASSSTLSQLVDQLLAPETPPPPPVDPNTNQTFVNNLTTLGAADNDARAYVKVWWFDLMMRSDAISAIDKLHLFWHNRFATEADTISDARFLYHHHAMLRRNALGNIKTFVKELTIDPGMLRYLNGDQNTASKPNENYARELQELFTIGRGKTIAPGNYTNYTEADIQAAARVLTGWRAPRNADPSKAIFLLNQHDKTNKQFSSAYNNTIIQGRNSPTAGIEELDDLLTMIFSQPITAQHYIESLYRFFVFYEITPEVENTVIKPLANDLFTNGYNILPVLRKLFMSNHFFSTQNIGAMMKSPLDFVVGVLNMFPVTKAAVLTERFTNSGYFATVAAALQQHIMEPPSVAGWTAYYQSPDFYKQWINSATLPTRYGFTDALIYGGGRFPRAYVIQTLPYIERISADPSNPYDMVTDISANLINGYRLTQEQITYLVKNVLMQGGQDYEWTTIWSEYKANPTNAGKKKAAEDRTKTLLRYMLRMSEFQLM